MRSASSSNRDKETSLSAGILPAALIGAAAGAAAGAATFEIIRANDWTWAFALATAAAGGFAGATLALLKRQAPPGAPNSQTLDTNRIAHDLRSPLAALEMVAGQLTQIPEEKRALLRSATGRIRDIANELMVRKAELETDANAAQLLSNLLDGLVSEKRLQYRGRLGLDLDFRLHGESYGLFARLDAGEFKKTVAEMIDASIRTIREDRRDGRIDIRLRQKPGSSGDRHLLVQIRANGTGISPETAERIGQSAKALGGELHLADDGRDTTLTLELAREKAPSWFVPRVEFAPSGTVIIADDDASVHQMWEGRFRSAVNERSGGAPILLHASTTDELAALVRSPEGAGADLLLVDYEFIGESRTGLDAIEELGIAAKAILVTSRFEESHLRERCERVGVRLVPKSMAGFVPVGSRNRITLPRPATATASPQGAASALPRIDAILIDDDELVHMTWKIAAGRVHKVLLTFRSVDEFLAIPGLARLPGETAIFVDSNLGNGVRGEQAAKALFDKGFRNISLATGYAPSTIQQKPEWIRRVVGKEPTFE